jgi:autotransporter-associated beta strand protein
MNYSGSAYTKVVELQGTSAISGTGFISSGLNIAEGAKATVTTVNRQTTSSALTGTGQVTIYCATEKGSNYYATRTPLQLKMSNFTGTLVAGAVYTADGRFTLDTSTGSNKYTLNIPSGIIVQNSGKTLSVGKLTGTGTLGGYCTFSNSGSTGTNTWNVGNDEDFTFDGVFTSADTFNKVGDGTMTVTNNWDNTGSMKVSGGTLYLDPTATVGTGVLTVASNGMLMGISSTTRSTSKKYPITNSSVTINGTLHTGATETATSGYFCFGSHPLTISATGKLHVGIAKCSTSKSVPGCTHIWSDDANGSVTFQDGATISVTLASSYNPATNIGTDETKADSFFVFNFAKATVGEVQFELPELPEHYYWDTTNFSKGYLYIRYKTPTGIRSSFADADPKNVYDLNGRLVRRQSTATNTEGLPAGIYIRGGKKFVVK